MTLGHFISNTFSAIFPTYFTGSLKREKGNKDVFFYVVKRKIVIKYFDGFNVFCKNIRKTRAEEISSRH